MALRLDTTYGNYRHSPDYSPYGFRSWPGGLARNPFNLSQLEPYNGRLDISDYLDELQLPQMLILAEKYDSEIMVRLRYRYISRILIST